MIGVIVFFFQTFLFGFTSAQQCKIPCQPCKEIAAPMPEEFRGNWELIDPNSRRCPPETPCLYRNEDMTSRICACDPGNITYTQSCSVDTYKLSGLQTEQVIAKIGSVLWTDRSYSVTKMPDELIGSTLFQTPYHVDISTIEIFSPHNAIVYIAVYEDRDGGLGEILPNQGWQLRDGWFVESNGGPILNKIWSKQMDSYNTPRHRFGDWVNSIQFITSLGGMTFVILIDAVSAREDPCDRKLCTENGEKKHCIKTFVLTEQPKDLFNNNHTVYLYNGDFPGPPLIVCQGDRVSITLLNKLKKENTTLHFHGIREKQDSLGIVDSSKGGPWSDGVPMVTQCPIRVNDSFTYTFLGQTHSYHNAPAGTYWYHSHTGRQRLHGAAGNLIIMPRISMPYDGRTVVDDPKNTLFVQEWYPDNNKNSLPTSLLVNGLGNQIPYHSSTPYHNYAVFPVKKSKIYRFRIIGGIGDDYPIRIDIEGHNFTAIATDSSDIVPEKNFNALWIAGGERYDILIETTALPRPGKPYKINVFSREKIQHDCRLCSLAWLKYHNQQVPAHEIITKPECCKIKELSFTKVLNPVPNNVADWVNENYFYPYKLTAKVQAKNFQPIPLNTQYITMPGITFNGFSMVYPNVPFLFQSVVWDIQNRCTVQCIERYVGSTYKTKCDPEPKMPSANHHHCGTAFPPSTKCKCQHIIEQPWKPGHHWFEIILINGDDKISHPIHHHGGWFNIVNMGQFPAHMTLEDIKTNITTEISNGHINANYYKPVFKDTVQVPTKGYVIYRLPIDNRGVWLVHCHINKHLENGMAMVIQIGTPPFSRGRDSSEANTNLNRQCPWTIATNNN